MVVSARILASSETEQKIFLEEHCNHTDFTGYYLTDPQS